VIFVVVTGDFLSLPVKL